MSALLWPMYALALSRYLDLIVGLRVVSDESRRLYLRVQGVGFPVFFFGISEP